MAEERLCLACRGAIHPEAVKCRHCGSYQDWRRWVRPIAALGSLGVAIPALAAWLVPQVLFWASAELGVRVTQVATTGDHVVALVENRGRKPLVVNQAVALWPTGPDLSGDGFALLDVVVSGSGTAGGGDSLPVSLIEARSTRLVTFYMPEWYGPGGKPEHEGEMFVYAEYHGEVPEVCQIEIEFAHSTGEVISSIVTSELSEDEIAYECTPGFWDFLMGVKPLG